MKLRATQGDKTPNKAKRFEELYRDSFSSVYNYAFYRTLNASVAEEVTSEVFLRAARFFDGFKNERASFLTWVKSIANNCIVDYYRKNRPTAEMTEVLVNTLEAPGDDMDKVGTDELVSQLLALLDDEERQLVYLKFYEEKRNTEIADELGMNASTVSTKLFRALAKMRSAVRGDL